jgi:hypothetical protein
MRYFSSEEQLFNFSIIVFILTSIASFRKIVRLNISLNKEINKFSRKDKKVKQSSEKND